MAHLGYGGDLKPLSRKQCLIAKEMHYECLDEVKSENNYLCPDTWASFKKWCPADVRQRLEFSRKEYLYNRDVWAKAQK